MKEKKTLSKITNRKFAGQVPNTRHDLHQETFEKDTNNNNTYIIVLVW